PACPCHRSVVAPRRAHTARRRGWTCRTGRSTPRGCGGSFDPLHHLDGHPRLRVPEDSCLQASHLLVVSEHYRVAAVEHRLHQVVEITLAPVVEVELHANEDLFSGGFLRAHRVASHHAHGLLIDLGLLGGEEPAVRPPSRPTLGHGLAGDLEVDDHDTSLIQRRWFFRKAASILSYSGRAVSLTHARMSSGLTLRWARSSSSHRS